jgi:oxygen-independent coproporphyrinogen-3 oxidase
MGTSLNVLGPGVTAAVAMASAADALRGTDPRFEGLYVHVPFCFHKCHYCDFYSFVDTEDRQEAFVARLEEELGALAAWVRAPLDTVFVGGGTPTLLAPPLLGRALRAVRERLPLSPGVEWTVEANPETVDDAVASTLASAGVNRVSLGAQSFDPRHLKTLERWHDPASVARAIGRLRAAGIPRISIDLIFGIPGQTIGEWGGDLARAIDLGTDHLSCYGLTYEPNTAMTVRLGRGEFEPCDEGVEAAMLEEAVARLARAGFDRYEVSNWARVRDGDRTIERCRHNMLYWRNRDWLAAGPSASGHAQGVRWKNVPRLGDWLASRGTSPVVDVERADADTVAGERLMMGLRLVDGMPDAEVAEILSLGARGTARRAAIDRAIAGGLLERPAGALRFTARGMMTANATLSELV